MNAAAEKHYLRVYKRALADGDAEGKRLAMMEYVRAVDAATSTSASSKSASGLRVMIDAGLGIPEADQLPGAADLKSEGPHNCNWADAGRYSVVTKKRGGNV